MFKRGVARVAAVAITLRHSHPAPGQITGGEIWPPREMSTSLKIGPWLCCVYSSPSTVGVTMGGVAPDGTIQSSVVSSWRRPPSTVTIRLGSRPRSLAR